MNDRRINPVWLFLCLFCSPVFSQESGTIRIFTEGINEPLAGALVILTPLNKYESKKQEVYFSNGNGEVKNQNPYITALFIESFGYKPIQDTIDPGLSYTYYLKKLTVDLNEVVVTGQYDINTSDKSVYSVKVIDQKIIQAMNATNLSDLLSNQLNARLTQDNILGSSVSIDGISGQNVKILIDGVNVIGRENGNIDLSQINLNNVERVEIIEGPMSVSYGTDAIGGLINIVTRKTGNYPFEANLNAYYESVGTYNGDGSLLWRKNNNSIAVSGGRYFFDGFSPLDTSRFQEWKPRLQYFGTIDYNYSSQFFNLGLKSTYFNQEIQNKGNPVLTPYQAYAFDDYYLTRRLNESVLTEWRFRNNAKLQLTNSYSNYRHVKNTYRKDLVTLEQSVLSGEGTQDTSVFDAFAFRGTYSNNLPVRKLNYQAGYDINLEKGKGEKLSNGVQRINDYALFGSAEYQVVKDLFIRPGLRASYNTRYGAPLTPSINIKYGFAKNYYLRASYARGFRAPSLKELNLYFVDVNHNILGNDSLKAEQSDNYRLSFTANNQVGDNRVKAEASLFYNDIENIIVLALAEPSTQLYTYVNIDKYKTSGATFTAMFQASHFSFTTGFSLLGVYNTLSDSFNIDRFSWSPEFQNNFLFTFPKPGIEGAIFLKNTGTTPGFNLDENGNVYQTFLEPYTMVDISLTKYFLQKHIGFSLGVKNLFNVVNIQSTSLDGSVHSSGGNEIPYSVGRFIFGTLRVKFYKE